MRCGELEYLDVNEEDDQNTVIAVRTSDLVTQRELFANRNADKDVKPYTHLEIDPIAIFGVVVGLVPFPHHNQASRNTF